MTADASWSGPMPEIYDRYLGPTTFAPFAADLAVRAARTGARRVLELAAGTGIVTAGLVEALPDAEVTATDLNPAMVEYAALLVPAARWQVADAMAVPFADASFDLVVCQFGVMFLPDRVSAYREVRRLLAPGGTYLFNAWDTIDTHSFEHVVTEAAREVLPEDPPDFLARTPHGYADPARITADLQAAGLRVADLARVELTGSTPSAERLAEAYCLGTPMRFDLQERGDLADLVPRIVAAVTRRVGAGPAEVEMAAYVAEAIKPG